MFGWGRNKRRRKRDLADYAPTPGPEIGDLPDGCGCDLPLIALTVMAGASLLYLVR